MPRNLKGGNKYKKGKKLSNAEDDEVNGEFLERQEGEQYGRINKIIGNNNALVFCNDGNERLCHIRGRLRKKKIWLNSGDIVLVSTRDFESAISKPDPKDKRGDILTKYETKSYKMLKRDQTINPLLFISSDIQYANMVAGKDDIGYEIEEGREEDEGEGEEEIDIDEI